MIRSKAGTPDATAVSGEELAALLVNVAREQGKAQARQEAAERRVAAQEARLAELEQSALARLAELTTTNEELRETVTLANSLLNEILRVCERYGWTKASGVVALEWLEHVLSLGTVSGWPSVN